MKPDAEPRGSKGSRMIPGASAAPSGAPAAREDITTQLALAIAFGNASATFDVVGSCASAGLPNGRFWYAGGVALERAVHERVLGLLLELPLADGAVPGDALYAYVGARAAIGLRGPFAALPLAVRLAYTTFATTLPPLLVEAARVEKCRNEAAVQAAARPLPNRPGTIGQRVFQRAPSGLDRVELTRRREAAE